MIRSEHRDRALIAALPFAAVVGDVRHEVRERAVGLAHHAVFVVAVFAGAQPQRAAVFVGVSVRDEFAHGFLDLAVAVQRRFEEIDVELHAERLEIEILFVTQIRDGEFADRFEIFRIARADHDMAVCALPNRRRDTRSPHRAM